jgi:hypothetical protein
VVAGGFEQQGIREMIHFRCPRPHCQAVYQVEDAMAGRKLMCPNCRGRVLVPAAPAGRPAQDGPARPGEGKEWFYERDGESRGPVRESDLKTLVADKRLGPDNRVWTEGMEQWQPAGDILPLLFADPDTLLARAQGSARRWKIISIVLACALVALVLADLAVAYVLRFR